MSENKGGRPTKYNPNDDWLEMVKNYALLGANNEEIAKYLEINTDTFYEWQKKHEEFSESLKAGREKADARVTARLYDRAIEGDVKAQEVWLRNRQRARWSHNGQQEVKLDVVKGSLAQEIAKANED